MYMNMEDFSRIMSGTKSQPRPPYSPDGAQDYAEPFPRLSLESLDFPLGVNGTIHNEKSLPSRASKTGFARSGIFSLEARHGRQKSLTEAINTIRTRKASMSQNAHEIADALKAPVSPKLVVSLSFTP
jgi:solute carrier family 35 protein E1